MSDTEYNFDEYPFTPIFPDGINEIKGTKPKQLDVTEDAALELAVKVIEDPFFRHYLTDRVKEKLNSGSIEVLREGLSSARGFQYKVQRTLKEQKPSAAPAKPKRTREITPLTDETKAKAEQVLNSRGGNVLPDKLRILLARPDENAVKDALEIAEDFLRTRRAHREEIAAIATTHTQEVQDIRDAHAMEVDALIQQITGLQNENLVLREQIPGWVVSTQRRWTRLKVKANRVLAAAREPEPEQTLEFPGHGGIPAPHLVAVDTEVEVVKAS